MIFGFNIITEITDSLANNIMEITNTKIGKYNRDMPKNNAVRGICVNYSGGAYYLRLEVNAGVLISGKETIDIEFVEEPDFLSLDEMFRKNLVEIIGSDSVEKLPPVQEWTLWILIYGMDVIVNGIEETMHALSKTNMHSVNFIPPKTIYDAGVEHRKIKIYPKSEMIKSGLIDFKCKLNDINTDNNIIRLSLIKKRSDMGLAKRFLKKIEADLLHLKSFLFPPLVTYIFIKEFYDSIGSGDFRNNEVVQHIENEIRKKCNIFSLCKEGSACMADNNYRDELYTITLHEQSEKGEKIPERIILPAKNHNDNKNEAIESKAHQIISKVQEKLNYYEKRGNPPVLTTASLIAKQDYYKNRTPLATAEPALKFHYKPSTVQSPLIKKSFIELAREYVDKTHEKTEHIPFICYWPSYEYMSQAQLNWYFYMRECIRGGEYIDTDISYFFIYVYELINQVGISNPDEGLEKLIDVWINYRKIYNKLDRYLTEWISDYITLYKCGSVKTFERLEKEGLFLLMPTDMLADYYFKNNLVMPIELISKFSDYKFYESEFIKGENGNLFIDYLSSVVHKIRLFMNKEKERSFEKYDILVSNSLIYKKLPFQRAIFNNPDNIRIETYLPYEQNKPFRFFITTVIKEFENQLRILTKYRGRLRPEKLSDDIINICKTYARNAFDNIQPEQKIEIKIDREKLLALIQDSDEVRKKLIEGNYEYDSERKPVFDDIPVFENIEVPAFEQVISETQESNSFKSGLTTIQQQILDFLLSENGSSTTGELSLAFPGTFIGVEIDKINDAALEKIGDLLIGFENEKWYIMEDYINDIN